MKQIKDIELKLCRMLLCRVLCGCALFGCAGLCSCSDDGQPHSPAAGMDTFVLNYTIPDTEQQEGTTRAAASSSPAPVPAVDANESRVSSLKLLFFERDGFGNGKYVGMADGTLSGGSIERKNGSAAVTLGNSSAIDANRDYNVLVIANAEKYISDDKLTASCAGKTENRVKLQLQAQMPVAAGTSDSYVIPTEGLPMSGCGRKESGKDMSVELLRAAVRIDVKVADGKRDELVLTAATLRNVSPAIPLFNLPADVHFVPLAFKDNVTAVPGDTVIRGGLYLTEVFRTGLDDPARRLRQSACLLVSCHKKTYTGSRTWYRVDINLEVDGSQYLKRNNAYTVVIGNVKSLGAATPEEAYMSDATLLKSVTIPTEWKTPEGVSAPEIEVN